MYYMYVMQTKINSKFGVIIPVVYIKPVQVLFI
jgi:hypothetical protein